MSLKMSVYVDSCQCITAQEWGHSAVFKALHTMTQLCKVISVFVVLQPSRTTAGVLQAKLLDIHRNTQQVRHQRRDRNLVLALNRSDYMLDEPSGTLMQVQLMPAWLCHSATPVTGRLTRHTHLAAHPSWCKLLA